jgi:hypothetical protein
MDGHKSPLPAGVLVAKRETGHPIFGEWNYCGLIWLYCSRAPIRG